MGKRDYYDVLGVPRRATAQDVRRAYRRLARQYSPDINVWDERAAGLFEEIAEAYRVLGDVAARALYDRLGHRAFDGSAERVTERDVRGDDLHHPIEIEFEEALRGATVLLDVTRQGGCHACGGTGGAEGRHTTQCPSCAGRPVRIETRQGIPHAGRCGECGGTGWRLPPPCVGCGGRGVVVERVRLPVTIPPGVDTGSQVRILGEGHAAPAPGRHGDLVVITRVRPHPFFMRKGDHLCCEVPITVPEAALGTRIRVPTLDGAVTVTVPPGTQSGQVLRIRGKGGPRLDREEHGDLLVTLRVTIPRNADSTLEEVLRALQRLLPDDPRAGLWKPRDAWQA